MTGDARVLFTAPTWSCYTYDMVTTLRAQFDGKVFVPTGPVDLPVNEPLELSIVRVADLEPAANGELTGLAKLAEKLKRLPQDPEAPTDLAAQQDHYLYGTPKRNDE